MNWNIIVEYPNGTRVLAAQCRWLDFAQKIAILFREANPNNKVFIEYGRF